jgi:hypothetical protein
MVPDSVLGHSPATVAARSQEIVGDGERADGDRALDVRMAPRAFERLAVKWRRLVRVLAAAAGDAPAGATGDSA